MANDLVGATFAHWPGKIDFDWCDIGIGAGAEKYLWDRYGCHPGSDY